MTWPYFCFEILKLMLTYLIVKTVFEIIKTTEELIVLISKTIHR